MTKDISAAFDTLLKEVVPKFPNEERTQNIFEILGCQSIENINSNLLAFFFDESEEHGLDRLFLDVLIELSSHKKINFEGEFVVYREYSTNNNGRIDILIKSKDASYEDGWAVIIENKLYASLEHNDLDDYSNSIAVPDENKLKIILCLSESQNVSKYKKEYKVILHEEFVDALKRSLGECLDEITNRHLFLLKEYFANIKMFNRENMKQMDKELSLFHRHKEDVKKLIDNYQDVLEYINQTLDGCLEKYNLESSSTNKSNWKHYYFKEEPDNKKALRVWVDSSRIRDENEFLCFVELCDKRFFGRAKHLREIIRNRTGENSDLVISNDEAKKNYCHIFSITFSLEEYKNQDRTLKDEIEDKFKRAISIEDESKKFDNAISLLRAELNES